MDSSLSPKSSQPDAPKFSPAKPIQKSAVSSGKKIETSIKGVKRPWWKFWEQKKSPVIPSQISLKPAPAPGSAQAEQPPIQPKMEEKKVEMLPPIPIEKIENLEKSQDQMLKTINNGNKKLGTQLDGVGKALTDVDGNVSALRKMGEKSLSSIDHMSSVMKFVETSVIEMQGKMKSSTKAYSALLDQVEKTEEKNEAAFENLKKKSLWTNIILVLGIIVTIVVLKYL